MQRKNPKGVEGGVVRRSKAKGMGRGGAQACCRGTVGVEQAQLQVYDAAHVSMCNRVSGTGKSLNNYSMLRKYCAYVCRSSQTYKRTYMRACLQRAYTREYVHTYLRYVRTCVRIYTYVCTYKLLCVRTYLRTYSGYSCLYMYVRTYARTYVRTYVLTHFVVQPHVSTYVRTWGNILLCVRTYVPKTSQMVMWLRPLCHRMHGRYERIRRVMGVWLR